jgi:hypothetical protein
MAGGAADMSGILIMGMEMPKSCETCQLATVSYYNTWCPLTKCFMKRGYSFKDCPLVELPPHGTHKNPWHTGTPTEDGDYLVKMDVEHNVYPYYVLKWNKKGWYSHYDMDYPACPQHSVLKWQKIEEASNGDGN